MQFEESTFFRRRRVSTGRAGQNGRMACVDLALQAVPKSRHGLCYCPRLPTGAVRDDEAQPPQSFDASFFGVLTRFNDQECAERGECEPTFVAPALPNRRVFAL